MTRPAPRHLLSLVVLLALALMLVRAFMPRPLPVDLAPVTRGALTQSVDEQGQTRVREVYVLSAPISGHLLRIDSQPGDEVSARQTVLARLIPGDPSLLDSRTLEQAEAAVQSAEAALRLAEAEQRRAEIQLEYAANDLRRGRELAAQGSLSEAELDRLEFGQKSARANLDTASAATRIRAAELDNARAMLQPIRTTNPRASSVSLDVRAPVSGQVLRVMQQSEGMVAAGTPLMEIGDARALEIVADLLSADAVRIKPGSTVKIEGWGGSAPLQGEVRRIEPYGFTKISALGIEEQRVRVIIDITSPPEQWARLGHGFRVDLRIQLWHTPDTLQLPLSALFREVQSWQVFHLEDGVARRRTVEIGRHNGEMAELIEGLAEGDEVVIYPSDALSDGALISRRGS